MLATNYEEVSIGSSNSSSGNGGGREIEKLKLNKRACGSGKHGIK